MTDQTKRALKRLPKGMAHVGRGVIADARGISVAATCGQPKALAVIMAASTALLEMLDTLADAALTSCRMPNSESHRLDLWEDAKEALKLLRETTSAMLGEK